MSELLQNDRDRDNCDQPLRPTISKSAWDTSTATMPPKPKLPIKLPQRPMPNRATPAPGRPARPTPPSRPTTKAAPSKRSNLAPSEKLIEFARRNVVPPPPPPPEYKPPKKWEQILA